MNKCFQVIAITMEPDIVKVRECDRGDDRHVREIPLYIADRKRNFKENRERASWGMSEIHWSKVFGWKYADGWARGP
jgi:hypothetical protein